jgi:PAS domain S-box-containing protein
MELPESPLRLPDGLLACAVAGPDCALRGSNTRFLEQLDTSAGQLHHRPLVQLFDPEFRAEVAAVCRRVLKGVPHMVVWPARTDGGRLVHCEWQLTPRPDGGLAIAMIPLESERGEARRAREAEGRFRSVPSALAPMVWAAGPDGAIRASNRAWRDFIGGDYPSPDLWRLVLHPEDYTAVMRLRASATLRGPPAVGSYRLRGRDGAYRWIEERVLRQAGENGETLLASCTDVTERRQMSERVEHALARAEGVLAGALDAIVTVDDQNRIVGFNPAAERMFGYSAREIRGHNVIRLMPERFRAGHTERVRSYVERGAPARRLGGLASGVTGLRADGSEFPMDASVSVVQTAQGRLVTAIIRDITEQAQSLQALQDREQRLRLAMESANLGSAEVDLGTGALTASNLAAARLLGLGDDPAGWVVPTFLEPIHPDDREFVRGTVEAIMREDRALDAEFRVLWPDGSAHWVYGRGRLRRGAEGQPQAVYGVLMDIHERKRHEAQLREQSQRVLRAQEDERRRIARELHDQIGQALTAALINLQMLPGSGSPGPVRELYATLGDVLQQVRELSLNLRPSMLDSLGLEAALRWYLERQRALGGFEVELRCPRGQERLPPDLETLVFRLVQEAVTNILRHARARHIRVSVERDGEHAVLTVRDDGVGFDPAEAMARAAQGGSFGVVGMAERAQLAGGSVKFESSPDKGTTVIAVLPLRR